MVRITRRELPAAPLPGPESLPERLRRIYAARGITDEADLDRSLQGLESFHGLPDIERATELLEQALRAGRRILVVGDYDADGATSTALAIAALRAFGAQNAGYLVPNRFEYGYGLTPEIVELAAQAGAELLVTVDNGISSIDGVAAANAAGMQVIVTDHHLPGDTLPEAAAIVNPVLDRSGFGARCIAGVGVIFYVMAALRARLRAQDWFVQEGIREPVMADFLDLVALGTVADVVPLDRNNRVLVWQGLCRIRAGRARPGIQALAEVAGRDCARLGAADLGFALAPRLNAAGRLDDMSLGVECLLAQHPVDAQRLAQQLEKLNSERKELQAEMLVQAGDALDALQVPGESALPHALSLYDATWHQGVIGILAGRLRDRTHRPVFVFAPADDAAAELKGSGRSIAGYHLRDALARLDARCPGLIGKFGGHARAAGLSLPAAHLERFRQLLEEDSSGQIAADALRGELQTDGELDVQEFSLKFATALRDAGPWGQGFPEPSFDGEFEVTDRRIVGGRHLKLALLPPGHERELDAIAFNPDPALLERRLERVRIVYRLDINHWRGRDRLQLLIEHLEPARVSAVLAG